MDNDPTSVYESLAQDIMEVVAEYFRCNLKDMKSANRKQNLVYARMFFAKCVRDQYPKLPMVKIGEMLGGRDHSTVVYYLKNMTDITDPYLKKIEEEIDERLRLNLSFLRDEDIKLLIDLDKSITQLQRVRDSVVYRIKVKEGDGLKTREEYVELVA